MPEEKLTTAEVMMKKYGITESDYHPKNISIGAIGVSMIVLAFSLVLIMDLITLVRTWKQIKKRLKEIKKRFGEKRVVPDTILEELEETGHKN